jgi:hypothetical protein
MPEVKAPIFKDSRLTTVSVKIPVIFKDQAYAIKGKLIKGLTFHFDEINRGEVIDLVRNRYLLSGIKGGDFDRPDKWVKEIKKIYETDQSVKTWIIWVGKVLKYLNA